MSDSPEQVHRFQVVGRDRRCLGPGPHRGRLQADHVVPRRRLKDNWKRLDGPLSFVIADGRNGLTLCEHCHGLRHACEIPWSALPADRRADLEEFAEQHDLVWSLDRDFPDRPLMCPTCSEEPAGPGGRCRRCTANIEEDRELAA